MKHLIQYNNDIDWFYIVGNQPSHFASNGGLLPRKFYSDYQLFKIMAEVMKLPATFKVSLNKQYIDTVLQRDYPIYSSHNNVIQDVDYLPLEDYQTNGVNPNAGFVELNYIWSFVEFAKRGFYSYDRDSTDGVYHLVASPVTSIDLKSEYNLYKKIRMCSKLQDEKSHAPEIIDIVSHINGSKNQI